MTVYVVERVCNDEYGCTEVEKIFSTREKAQAYIDNINDEYYPNNKWVPWWLDGVKADYRTIDEIEME